MYNLDANALIYYLGGEKDITQKINQWRINRERFIVSTIVETELLALPALREGDIEVIERLLNALELIPVDSQIARLAGSLRREYRLKLGDSIIGATSIMFKAPLVTRNVKDFRKVTEIEVIKI